MIVNIDIISFIFEVRCCNDNNITTSTINDKDNRAKHRKYKIEVKKIKKFDFGGRLADYAYYDMDMTISAALKKFDQIKKKIK